MEMSMDRWSDEELMARTKSGDTSAFDLIVRRYQDRLQQFATRMFGGDSSSGGDVVVGAFLRLWERRATFCMTGQLSGWLFKTTYRLCLDVLAVREPDQVLDFDEPETNEGPDELLERESLTESIRFAVMELPQSHRAVLILAIYEGMSYEEISANLGIPTGTVASRKNHALTILRRRLAAWETK